MLQNYYPTRAGALIQGRLVRPPEPEPVPQNPGLGAQTRPGCEAIGQMFEAQVARTPDAVAVSFRGRGWTYRELNGRANQVAHHLRALGVGVDVPVGLCVDRSLEMAAAVLGVLKAGGAYVPLDPNYPAERLRYMLADARPPVVLTRAATRDRLPSGPARRVCLDADAGRLAREPADDPAPVAAADSLGYVLYTSGSTGRPKGIAMGQRALANLIRWQVRTSPAGPGDRTLQFASLSFDVSFQELFATWCSGGTLVLIGEGLRRDPAGLVELLTAERVGRLFLPCIALQRLTDAAACRAGALADLREVMTAGEQLVVSPRIADLFARRPDCALHNQYGPTEAAVIMTAYTLQGPPDTWPTLPPIGRPIDGAYVRVLDADRRPVPVGEPGDLYLGGVCLARGYLNRPDLTAERFLPDPLGTPGDRLYWTGDRARLREDGELEFLGRVDHQVKVNGFRVELGEVEATLGGHPGVREAVVASPPGPGDRRLVAYLVADPGHPPSVRDLRRFLRDRLPWYMVPSAFVWLAALPLTPSGKVDRAALPAPADGRPDLGHPAVPPRTALERELVGLWEEMLGVRPVGVTDTFAGLGGGSLQAADMLVQVRKRLGKDPPVLALSRELTVERLAALVGLGDAPEPWSALVPLQPRGNKPPLFLVHGIGGEVISLTPLVRRLSPGQPVYGLQNPFADGVCRRFPSIEAMAGHYVGEVLAVRPEGALRLAGYSFGGAVAFEMARQLTALGHRVGVVAVIDEPAPGPHPAGCGLRAAARFVGNLGPWVREELATQTAGQFVTRAARKLRAAHRWVLGSLRSRPEEPARPDLSSWLDPRLPEEFLRFCEHNYSILQAYSPVASGGVVTVLRARVQPLFGRHEPDLGWGRLAAGRVTTLLVPGNHDSILREPRVQALASALQAALDGVAD